MQLCHHSMGLLWVDNVASLTKKCWVLHAQTKAYNKLTIRTAEESHSVMYLDNVSVHSCVSKQGHNALRKLMDGEAQDLQL